MISKRDVVIIANLRENARQNLTNMSRKTRVPVSTIFDRIREHEQDTKVISKYTCLVDFEQLGFGMRVNLLIKVAKQQRSELSAYLEKHSAVNSAYKINNSFDFLAECIFKSLKDLDKFIESLESQFSVMNMEVLYIVEEIKREKFLSNPELVPMMFEDGKAYKINPAQNAE